MKRIFNTKSSKAFTLIELIVVIAVLAILAVGVIAAINPATKIKQAKDANTKAAMGQIINSLQSHFTSKATGAYAADLATLVNDGEMTVIPKDADGNAFTYKQDASGNARLYAPSYVTGSKYWCWTAAAGTIIEVTLPGATTITCP